MEIVLQQIEVLRGSANWKNEPGQTLIAGEAQDLQKNITLITTLSSIYLKLCVNNEWLGLIRNN